MCNFFTVLKKEVDILVRFLRETTNCMIDLTEIKKEVLEEKPK